MGEISIHTATEISLDFDTDYKYSVCTLVTDKAEYQEMIASFIAAGFDTSFCEYIYIDNSSNNKSDAYHGLNYFLQKAKGKYIILCHQDILLCYDNLVTLEIKIHEIDQLDINWGILSNAGAVGIKNKVIKFTEPNKKTQTVGVFPSKVLSVDESFILVKKSANLALSNNIEGFHFYGTDLCMVARALGYSSYVVEFNLLHKSNGTLSKDFYKVKESFINKYSKLLTIGYVQTTCTIMYISDNHLFNSVLNNSFVLFLVRNYCSLKLKIKKKLN